MRLLVSWSWLAALVATTVACAAAAHVGSPGLTVAAKLLLGLALSLALSVSILVHEYAHALVAMKAGIEIDHIRLFAAGALCQRNHPIGAPREQFMVAAAGPLASTALGVIAIGIALATSTAGLPPLLSTALWFLAFANILIAVSNLLPVFPFDGGKLVHALFWRSGRDPGVAADRLRRSGREFSRLVTAFGFLLMAFGGEVLVGALVSLLGLYLLRLPPP